MSAPEEGQRGEQESNAAEFTRHGFPKRSWQQRLILIYNWISLFGLGLVLVGLITGTLTFLVDFVAGVSLAYSGMLMLVFLLLVVIGLFIIPVGMVWEGRRRNRKGITGMPNLVFDLGQPRQQAMFVGVLSGILMLLMGMAAGSYKIYHATESNEFCGTVCHQVMTPEYTAYNYSSHARVDCVECHIGSGAEWYVRSKFSGLRQVYAVMLDKIPSPIPTPITDLRPARETCERCHWPNKFIGYKELVRTYYHADEASTPMNIRMLMKIGGEEHALMKGSGIHYHMLISGKVEYIARDNRRQEIPWVRITHQDGAAKVFESTEEPLTEEEKASMPVRQMDCMDCHNRPSHQFPTPMRLVNQALTVNSIDRSLPGIKLAAVQALDGQYETTDDAMAGIAEAMNAFYEENHPEALEEKKDAVNQAILALQRIYQRAFFPEMKASYAVYPDNIGHRDWPGCFRCHNETMATEDGDTIFTTCNKCHLILAQGEDISQVNVNFNEGLAFIHPDGDEELDEYTECTECHTGGASVYE